LEKGDKILTSTFLCAQAAPTRKLRGAFIIMTEKCTRCIKDEEPQCTMTKVVGDKGTGDYCNQCSNKKASPCSLKIRRDNLITVAATAMSIVLRGVLAHAQDLDDVLLIRGITNVITHTLSLLEEVHPATLKTVKESLEGPSDSASKILANMANPGKGKGFALPMGGKRATR
jgi:D-arabinose 1-dehydrogenase-like Zn-dependent alcohol dehydrogenase